MVKSLVALVAGLVAASEFDHTEMLQQKSTRKSVTRHSSTSPDDWQDDVVCGNFGLDYSLCPMSLMDDIETGFQQDKDALDDVIAGLEEDIAKKEAATERAENQTENFQTATANAVAKAAKANADIVLVKEKMVLMDVHFEEKLLKVNTSLKAISAKVQRILDNAQKLGEFTHPNVTDTSLIQKWGRWKPFDLWKAITEWAQPVIEEVVEVVVEKTSEVLEDNGNVYQFKVEDAQEGMKNQIADLDATVGGLEQALLDEQADLTAALATRQEARENKTAAIEYKNEVAAALRALKQQASITKQNNNAAIQKINGSIKYLKEWLASFEETFSPKLLRAMSEQDF